MKNIKKYQPWNIISPFDLPEIKTHSPLNKNKQSKSSKTSRTPSPITIRKSLPRKIDSLSHLLTPTQSSMHKKVEKSKKLIKSKSASDLRPKVEIDQKKLKEEEILNELCRKVAEIQVVTEENKGLVTKVQRKSCPEFLKIDVEEIEKEFEFGLFLRKEGLAGGIRDEVGVEFGVKGVKGGDQIDVLDGKIFCSRLVEVQRKGAWIRENRDSGSRSGAFGSGFKVKRREAGKGRVFGEEEVEVVVEMEVECFKEKFDFETWKKLNLLVVAYQTSLLNSTLSILHQLKPHKVKFQKPSQSSRKLRSLADVSTKLSILIKSSLSKPSNPPSPSLPSINTSSLIYCTSQDCIFNLILILINPNLKPLTSSSISLLSKSKALTHTQPFKLQVQNELISIFLTKNQLSQAEDLIFSYPEKNSSIFTLWKTLLSIIKHEKISESFELISRESQFGEFLILFKLALVYSFYQSCYWLKSSRAVAYCRRLGLGEWEEVVVWDLMLRSGDRNYEESGEKGLMRVLEGGSNVFVKFLAFYRIFLVYKGYNQYSKALNLIKIAEKNKFNGDLKDMFECCSMKIYAKLGMDLNIKSDVLLVKYQFSRLSLKYSSQPQLDKILVYLNETCAYCQEFSINTSIFPVNFWKFILLRNLKLQKMTEQQAKLTLGLYSKDKLKISAIQDYLKSLENLEEGLKKLEIYSKSKDLNSLSKVLTGFEKLDPYLSTCFQMIISKFSLKKEKFSMKRFEGFFAVWSQFYRKSKAKEKIFKGLEGQEEIDKRDHSHPLHILVKIKEHWHEIIWIYENSFSASPALLWGLFGKSIGGMSLKQAYRIMQAKSYLRTNVLRAIHKLQKEENCPIIVYYLAKLSISIIKYEKTASDSSFQSIFSLLKKFSNSSEIHTEYQVKVLYMQAELAFMTKSYQLALEYLTEAMRISNLVSSGYLNKSKRALNLELARSRLSN